MLPPGLPLLLKPLEASINRLIGLDPEAQARLRPLVGRVLLAEIAGLDLKIRVYFSERGMSLSLPDPEDPKADASVRLSPAAALSLARSRGEQAQGVEFQGDVAVVHAVRRLIGELEIDWEEQLSKLTGDVIAHQVGSLARGFGGWLGHARRSVEQNVSEYLTEESRQLPAHAEVQGFLDDVDRLRQDVDRASARLDQLERSRSRDIRS
jgi:ubiquinone biosynthesis protein UbiJ